MRIACAALAALLACAAGAEKHLDIARVEAYDEELSNLWDSKEREVKKVHAEFRDEPLSIPDSAVVYITVNAGRECEARAVLEVHLMVGPWQDEGGSLDLDELRKASKWDGNPAVKQTKEVKLENELNMIKFRGVPIGDLRKERCLDESGEPTCFIYAFKFRVEVDGTVEERVIATSPSL